MEEKYISRGEIEKLLKKAADLLRNRVDYTFILVLLFYKRICDKWKEEYKKAYEEALKDGFSPEEAEVEARKDTWHDFIIPPEFLWDRLREDPEKLPENFSKAMKSLAENNTELRDVFSNIDFVQFTSNPENAEILRQLVELFSTYSLSNVSPDILGDAYEWILRYFAPQKAKEGEVYTPREVIRLIVEILNPQEGESVYDPACGSAGMLIMSYKYVEDRYGKNAADKLFLYGQEANSKTLALGKMNLYIHDIRNGILRLGDTLLYPKFKKLDGVQKFNVVIANPPWNQDGYAEDTLKKSEFWRDRFRYGFPTKQSADWAWIQHMLASSDNENGRVGVVIDNGALFRSGREKNIRKSVIEEDLLDAVILLPEKLFYNTGAPGAILIFTKNKSENRRNRVVFINASLEFEQHPEVRKLNRINDLHIKKIVEAYRDMKEEEGFSRIVTLDAIKENDYNLNVSLYVYPVEEEEEIDILAEWRAIQSVNKELKGIEDKIEGYLKELGYGEKSNE